MSFKALFFLGAAILLSWEFGCSNCHPVLSNPAPPPSVPGWHEFEENGIHAVGGFLLKKGEYAENGKFGVQLVDTKVPVSCSDLLAEPDVRQKAVVRFYSLPSKQTLALVEISRNSSTILSNTGFTSTDYGVSAIYANEINSRDGWVWFELWR